MALLHEWEFSTHSNWSDVPVACDADFISLPISHTTVGVWSVDSLSSEPLHFVGHHKEITALCFGHNKFPKLLCSAATDYIIVWNIHKAKEWVEKGDTIKGKVVGTTSGDVQALSFSPDDDLVAACVRNDIIILSAVKGELLATLEGHVAPVTCATFCPHYSSTIVSISEDRTFKVWSIAEMSLVYQSSIISSSPFITMAMNPNKEQVAIGTTDGQLRVYDLSDGNGFRCLHHLDVDKISSRINREKQEEERAQKKDGPTTISSRPSWQRDSIQQCAGDVNPNTDDQAERSCAILGLCYTEQGAPQPVNTDGPLLLQRENTAVRDILNTASILVIGTPTCLLQVNAFTLEVCSYQSLQDPVPMTNSFTSEKRVLATAGSVHISHTVPHQVCCLIRGLFQSKVHVLKWNLAECQNLGVTPSRETTLPDEFTEMLSLSGDPKEAAIPEITILSSVPLLENSVLKSELTPKQKEDPKSGQKKGKTSSVTDQPLTFKSKVKSSGYSSTPRKMLFRPQTNVSKGNPANKKPIQSLSERIGRKKYPVDSDPPVTLSTTQSVAERPTPINCIHISDDGHSLACGLGNKSVQEFRLPLTGKGMAFTGHNGPVHSVHYSHGDSRLLSSSEDRTVHMWVKGQSEPIMSIIKMNNNFTAIKDSAASKGGDQENPAFSRDVRFAQFYYVDKFILLASGNSFYLYKYHLDPTKEDIKRYLTKSRYKLVKSFQLEQAQTVTELRAVNSFHSYIVMAAGSDRSLNIFDLNVGKISRVLNDIHTKQCHVVQLNEGSSAVSHPSSVYDLFATAAMTDCIKLWDIRTNRCVRRYEGHQNRCYPCGLDLSPCGRFLATGAEDKSAYMFDLRSGTYLHKLTGHTDVVSDVTFHPIKPQLLTACLDGKIRLFTSS